MQSIRALVVLGGMAALAHAQPHFAAGSESRRLASLEFLGEVSPTGWLRIDYGSSPWREAFEDRLVAGEDQYFQLGRGSFARLDASQPFSIGDTDVPAGIWYLGLHRTQQGAWSLTLLHHQLAHRDTVRPGADRRPPVDLEAALQLSEPPQPIAELDIAFAPSTKLGRATLTLGWGPRQLRADVRIDLKPVEPDGVPEFRPLDPAQTRTTDSGLRYQQLRAGSGDAPAPDATVTVRYTGWLPDGTRFDSTRAGTLDLPLQGVIRGWQEAVGAMRPGAQWLVQVPPALGYGERGAPPRIPPGTDLIFLIELVSIR